MKTAPLELEFHAAPLGGARLLAWLALVAGVLLALWISERHGRTQQELDALLARHDALESRLRPPRAPRPEAPTPETARRIQQANGVIQRLTLPWEALFRAVEAADSRALALLSLEPNARDMTLRLSGEARSVGELLAYVDRLALQPALAHVHLVSYETVQREGVSVITFVLAARWQAS